MTTMTTPPNWTALAKHFLVQIGIAEDAQDPWHLMVDELSLVEQLTMLWQEAREAWPQLNVTTAQYLAYIAERVAPEQQQHGDAALHLLTTLRAADLYLACACCHGDSKAIAHFEDTLFQPVFAIVTKRLRIDPARFEEVKQVTHNKLFVADPGKTPKIASYNGQGKLFRWLEVVFTRATMKMIVRKDAKEVQLEDQVIQRLSTGDANPELQFLKSTYKGHFKAAFADAMEALSAKERNTLRYFYVDGLNIDAIGSIHGVHRATVARWLNQIRTKLFRDTRKRLTQRMQITEDEVESVLGLIQSQLELSMRLFFAPDETQ